VARVKPVAGEILRETGAELSNRNAVLNHRSMDGWLVHGSGATREGNQGVSVLATRKPMLSEGCSSWYG
jgi:hypothetical protein